MADDQNKIDDSDDVIQSIPSIQGEESVSGTESDPESDDDTLRNAQSVGTQLDEDEEHPQEVDIGRDINEAEKSQWEH